MSSKIQELAEQLGMSHDEVSAIFAPMPHWEDSFQMAESCLETIAADYDRASVTDPLFWAQDHADSMTDIGKDVELWLARNSDFLTDYIAEYGPVTLTGDYPHTLEGIANDVQRYVLADCLYRLIELLPTP